MIKRVLLLDVGTPREELSEPIGIETIASYVEAEFPDIELVFKSLELDDTKSVDDYFSRESFGIIGISTKIRAYNRIDNIISSAKRYNKDVLIVLGDILSTFAYDKLVNIYPDIICVRGEGEESFTEIVRCYLKNGHLFFSHLKSIPNLSFKYYNKIVTTQRSVIDVRNAKHPKRFSLDYVSKQYGIVHLEASRGCIYSNCSFCGIHEKYNGAGWRPFEIDFIIKELEILSNANFKSPFFTDEDFFGNDVERVIEICERIIKAKKQELINPDMNFYFNARAGSILGDQFGGIEKSKKVLMLLKKAGLREIFIGFESGEKDQIRRYNKMTTVDKNMAAINILKSLGIDLDAGFIFFDPQATLQSLRGNINFILESGLNTNYSRLLKKLRLQPFTKITNDFLEKHPACSMNLNLVCYDYDFLDSQVGDIYDIFSSWESEDLDIIYNMQSFCRGEVITESERNEVKDIISTYRFLDVEYLNAIITSFENNCNSKKYLEYLTGQFKRIREQFDKKNTDKIKWFDSSYRRFNRWKG